MGPHKATCSEADPKRRAAHEALPATKKQRKEYLSEANFQLGYRGNCINFVNDNAAIARQLPRAVSETGLIFYVIKGTDKADGSEVARLKRVRRAAVRDWLKFLADHHCFYKHGIRNRDVAPGTPGEWLVPPFEFPAGRAK